MNIITRIAAILMLLGLVTACSSAVPSASVPTPLGAAATTMAPSHATAAPTMSMGTTPIGMTEPMTGTMIMPMNGTPSASGGVDMGGMPMNGTPSASGGMDMGGMPMEGAASVPTVTPGIAANISPATPDLAAFPVIIQNCGRTLTFARPPERVVALYPLTAEFLLRLGLQDRIVGAAFATADPVAPDLRTAFNALPVLTTDAAPNKELLFTAQPDFVIDNFPGLFYNAAQGLATVEELQSNGIQPYTLTARCDGNEANGKLEDLYTDLENLGKIFGVSNRASQYIEELKGRVAAVQTTIAGQPKPKVLLYDSGVGPINIFGPGAISNVAEQAGGDNVFADGSSEFLMLSAEEVAARNPDVFVVMERQGNRMMSMGKDLSAQEAADFLIQTFPNTNAAKNNRVVMVPYQQLYASLQNIDGVETVAKALYPELFQ